MGEAKRRAAWHNTVFEPNAKLSKSPVRVTVGAAQPAFSGVVTGRVTRDKPPFEEVESAGMVNDLEAQRRAYEKRSDAAKKAAATRKANKERDDAIRSKLAAAESVTHLNTRDPAILKRDNDA